MLPFIALAALAFSPTVSPADTFTIAFDGEIVEAGPVGETSLGDFVVVKQWDAWLGDFVIVKQWDAVGEVPVEETETSLGDFVIVKEWDISSMEICVSRVQDDLVGPCVEDPELSGDVQVLVLAYPDASYKWHAESEEDGYTPGKYGIALD